MEGRVDYCWWRCYHCASLWCYGRFRWEWGACKWSERTGKFLWRNWGCSYQIWNSSNSFVETKSLQWVLYPNDHSLWIVFPFSSILWSCANQIRIEKLAQRFNDGKVHIPKAKQKPLKPSASRPLFWKSHAFNRAIAAKSASFSSSATHREPHDPPRFQDTKGGQTLAPIARRITNRSVRYLNAVLDWTLTRTKHIAMNRGRQMRIVLKALAQRRLGIRRSDPARRSKTAL